jgi:hypothetical protein
MLQMRATGTEEEKGEGEEEVNLSTKQDVIR